MSTPATYDDVNLILRLYELRREETLRKARTWYYQKFAPASLEEMDKLAPMGTQENAYVRMVISYWEMVASFVTSGVLNPELLFQSSGEMLVVWLRLKPILAAMREARGTRTLFHNLETVALEYEAHFKRTDPGAFEAMLTRFSRPPAAPPQA